MNLLNGEPGAFPRADIRLQGEVSRALRERGPEALPEAPCYLLDDGRRFDFTRRERNGTPIERFVAEETIEPSGVGEYKTRRHRTFLARWSQPHGLGVNRREIWPGSGRMHRNPVPTPEIRECTNLTRPKTPFGEHARSLRGISPPGGLVC